MTVPHLKKLKPKPVKFRKVLVTKNGESKKLKAYSLFVKGAANRFNISLPKLDVAIRDNIDQLWVIPQSEQKLPQPFTLVHGRTAFLESGIHDYSAVKNKLDYYGMALGGNTLFIFILKET